MAATSTGVPQIAGCVTLAIAADLRLTRSDRCGDQALPELRRAR